jgi:uncharacterized protein
MIKFEWDKVKNELNLAKHGIGFDEIKHFVRDPLRTEILDTRFAYGEDRLISTALVNNRFVTVVFVDDGNRIRLISARLATRVEIDDYVRR